MNSIGSKTSTMKKSGSKQSRKSLGVQMTQNSAHEIGQQTSLPIMELPEEHQRISRNMKGRTSGGSGFKEADLLEETYGSGQKWQTRAHSIEQRSQSVSLAMRSSLNIPNQQLGKDRIRVEEGKIIIKKERVE